MATQLLVSTVSVTLDAGDTLEWSHGLFASDKPVKPTQIIAGGPTTIGVTAVDDTTVTFTNLGPDESTALFRAEYDHSIHAVGAQTVAWSGWDGSTRPAGPAGGDLDGTYPDPTVVGLNTYPLDLTAPVSGDYLRFDGTTWRHTLVSPGDPTAIFGCFSSTVDQDVGTTPHIATFNTVEAANGVTIVAGTRLTVSESGVYALNLSPQMTHGGGGTETITFWLRIDGANVPNSASSFEMGNNNNRTLPFFEQTLPLNAGQYVEWVFKATVGTDLKLKHFPAEVSPPAAFAIPAIPSVVANVKRLGAKV